MTNPEVRLRVFISHAPEDVAVATALTVSLASRPGATIFTSHRTFEVGSFEIMEREADAADMGIVVLSPSLFKSHFATREMAALFRRADTDPDFELVPVMIELTDPPGFLQGHQYVDARGLTPIEVAARTIAVIDHRGMRQSPTFPITSREEYVERLRRIQTATAEDDALDRSGWR
jgi:hypothetical protein